MTVLLLAAAAACFAVSASRRFGKVPWLDLGLVLLAVAFIFWTGTHVDLD